MSSRIEILEKNFLAKKAYYEEQELYRDKFRKLKFSGLIYYKDIAKELGVSNGFISHYTTGKSNFEPIKFAKLKKILDEIEAAAGLEEEEYEI